MTTIPEARTLGAATSDAGGDRPAPAFAPRRGRPLLVSREAVLERIRQMAARSDGLFRVHRSHPALYARARRLYGSWAAAVRAAGLDYDAAVGAARERSLRTRRQKTRRRPAAAAR
uniref:Uncharacterized protein n=1 Tax=Eiseniibacteriota bacterium TaxID=2212470 RepID=A0A832MLG9_UNCEI